MALESATYINGLTPANPTASDPLKQADDHIRLIKTTLKNTFPNIDAPVTVTEDDLNEVASMKAVTDDAMTTSNGGAGSGYDADLLDGKEAAEFVLVDDYEDTDVLTKVATASQASSGSSGLDAEFVGGYDITYLLDASNLTGEINHGRLPKSDQATAEAGTSNNFVSTPRSVKWGVNALAHDAVFPALSSGGTNERFNRRFFVPPGGNGDHVGTIQVFNGGSLSISFDFWTQTGALTAEWYVNGTLQSARNSNGTLSGTVSLNSNAVDIIEWRLRNNDTNVSHADGHADVTVTTGNTNAYMAFYTPGHSIL